MVQYYWNPNLQQPKMQNPNMQQMQNPNMQQMQQMQQMHMQQMAPFQQMQQPMVPPPVTIPSGRPSGLGEQSYIENILRLNIGEPGIFHFSFAHTIGEALNVRNVTGSVEAAGRDHVIVKEAATGHQFLFPMIYFDYAEFAGQVKYFPQTLQQQEI